MILEILINTNFYLVSVDVIPSWKNHLVFYLLKQTLRFTVVNIAVNVNLDIFLVIGIKQYFERYHITWNIYVSC